MVIEMQGNILANRSVSGRNKSDYYPTPEDCTITLVDYLNIPKGSTIWEPACGQGHMSRALEQCGYRVISTDIEDYGCGYDVEDFLQSSGKECDWIITNPPFSLSSQFIEKAISLKKPFALLLKSQYWHSKNRMSLFNKHRPMYVLPLTWRPDFEFGKRGGSPTMECIWTVWGENPSDSTVYRPLCRTTKLIGEQ